MSSAAGDTATRLLDAAERLFAVNGIEQTTLRAITAEARANLASVNYHFGSKDALLEAVFKRRVEPVNNARLALLSQATSGTTPPSVENIVNAFVGPPLEMLGRPEEGGKHFPAIMGRVYSDPGHRMSTLLRQFDHVFEAFVTALVSALPGLPRSEILWRFFNMVGTMAFYMVAGDLILARTQGLCDPTDVDANKRRVVAFVSAGFRAPFQDAKEKADV